MDLREKYKWAIDFIKSLCGKEAEVLFKGTDYNHTFGIAIAQGERMAGIYLQRAKFERNEEERKCVGLYQLDDTQKNRRAISIWVDKFLATD